MDKQQITLAALSTANRDSFSPVQIQKLLFIIDRELVTHLDGPIFDFKPYDYGPFDQDVYRTLDILFLRDLVEIQNQPGKNWNLYRLTDTGQQLGEEELSIMAKPVVDYMRSVSHFVRSLSFAQLVSSIYNKYPDMKVNSVFGK